MGIGGMCGQDELGVWVGSFCDAGAAWAGEWTTGLGCWAAAGGTVDWAGERAGCTGAVGAVMDRVWDLVGCRIGGVPVRGWP